MLCYPSGQVNQTKHLFKNIRRSSPEFDCNLLSQDGIWYMQRWLQFNSDRLDVQLNTPDERTTDTWNYNVYDLDGGDGFFRNRSNSFLDQLLGNALLEFARRMRYSS